MGGVVESMKLTAGGVERKAVKGSFSEQEVDNFVKGEG